MHPSPATHADVGLGEKREQSTCTIEALHAVADLAAADVLFAVLIFILNEMLTLLFVVLFERGGLMQAPFEQLFGYGQSIVMFIAADPLQ